MAFKHNSWTKISSGKMRQLCPPWAHMALGHSTFWCGHRYWAGLGVWEGSGSPRVSDATLPHWMTSLPWVSLARDAGVTEGWVWPRAQPVPTGQGHCSSAGLQTREANTKALKVQVSSSCHRLKFKCPTLNYIQAPPMSPYWVSLATGHHYLVQLEALH